MFTHINKITPIPQQNFTPLRTVGLTIVNKD